MHSPHYRLRLSAARLSRSRRSSWGLFGCLTVEICSNCMTPSPRRSRKTQPSPLQHRARALSFATRMSPVRACRQVSGAVDARTPRFVRKLVHTVTQSRALGTDTHAHALGRTHARIVHWPSRTFWQLFDAHLHMLTRVHRHVTLSWVQLGALTSPTARCRRSRTEWA